MLGSLAAVLVVILASWFFLHTRHGYAHENDSILRIVGAAPNAERTGSHTVRVTNERGNAIGWSTRYTFRLDSPSTPDSLFAYYQKHLAGWRSSASCCGGPSPVAMEWEREGAVVNINADNVGQGAYEVTIDAHGARTRVRSVA
jgi:hypothetical protein